MQSELKNLAVLQTGKVLAVLYGVCGVVILPFILIAALLGGKGALNVISLVFLLVLYPLIGFVSGIILAFLYNLVAQWVGGLRFTLTHPE